MITKPMKTILPSRLPPNPILRFNPLAWAKLIYLRDRGETEIGGFAVSSAEDLLRIEDFQLVRQTCCPVTVAFDDTAVADYFDRHVDLGLRPERFARAWCHTHPGQSPEPSITDEETFERVFSSTEWALMFILARGGQTYARLRFNVGPGGSVLIPVEVDFSRPFVGSDQAAWEEEYRANIDVLPDPFIRERLLRRRERSTTAEQNILAENPASDADLFEYESLDPWEELYGY